MQVSFELNDRKSKNYFNPVYDLKIEDSGTVIHEGEEALQYLAKILELDAMRSIYTIRLHIDSDKELLTDEQIISRLIQFGIQVHRSTPGLKYGIVQIQEFTYLRALERAEKVLKEVLQQ